MKDALSQIKQRHRFQVTWKIALLALSILLISCAHYFTGTQFHLYHDIFRRLYYLPIFIAALWFGLKGGLGASVASSMLYAPHVVFQWKIVPSMELEKYLEILLFNIVGALTGLLAERANRQRDLYKKTAEELESAYHEVQKSSARLLLVEKKLRQAEKISALGEMSATVAHEFMNPLGSIKGAIEILKDEFPEDNEKHAFLKILIKEIDRLDRTVRSVLRFSRKERLAKSLCNPEELIETILTLTQGEIKQRGIRVNRRLARDAKHLLLDADKIQQVLLNLVMNAIQAMTEGGELTVSSERLKDPPMGMESEEKGSKEGLLVIVEDTGIGIPEKEIPQIFESFYTTREEGTGLGLAIVRKIIRAHEGGIRVESKSGSGTRVLLWLPFLGGNPNNAPS